ncbi:hypothetical protein MIND_00784300 [Mycena indigotica]|uniref:Uncharacterized protein n=1 Tax=Mycena indigotica TaxID=2126181 RepID=A0A8H6W1K8_9AGAR|nr:uncharacterized protein MIND_00784300 [Mycena indigotica]KAF7302174.1 hypothetical protein MIND_00784300 [Mycena indigotica]
MISSTVSRSSMRIVALPLTRINTSATIKLPRPTFYRFNITPPPPKPLLPRTGWLADYLPQEGIGKWVSNKANQTWISWGAAPEGSIKVRVSVICFPPHKLATSNLDFEETNLKSLDLSIAPPLHAQEKAHDIPLFYPPTMLSGPQSLENLKTLVEQRIPIHSRGIYLWIFFGVLSAPLKLIPIIPNFPFYFCAWRTWSHVKARRAARYIKSLIDSKRVVRRHCMI